MLAVDPRDADAVAERLRAWASERFGGAVRLAGPATSVGAGFDSYIHFLQLGGDPLPPVWRSPLAVRLLPSPDRLEQARREAAMQGWCAEHGFPAPVVHAVLAPHDLFGLPAQVMQRAPGVTALDALKARPWQARRLLDQVVALQLRLHSMDVGGWPGLPAAADLYALRTALPRAVVERVGDPALARALDRAEALRPTAIGGPAVVCHGDFHPLNVVTDGDAAAVVDWSDAGLGPREADVSRTLLLFHVASIAATGALERGALRLLGPRLADRYRRVYLRGAELDAERMRAWEALHSLHGWSQVVMLHAGGFDGGSSADASRIPAGLAAYLQLRFEAAVR